MVNRSGHDNKVLTYTYVDFFLTESLFFLKKNLTVLRVTHRHRHSKLFISGPCRKRTDDLLKLSRHQLKIVVAILTGHAPVKTHLRTVGLFEGDAIYSFCMKEAETVQHIICCCEALAHQRFNLSKTKHNVLYIRNQTVPRCNHFPPRL
jgi:hypothetical protein